MVDPGKLNRMLRARPVPERLNVHVGDELDIALPRVPLTAETEFVELVATLEGAGAIDVRDGAAVFEGASLPRHVHALAIHPGRSVISVHAIDPFSRKEIDGVEPVRIVIDVAPSEVDGDVGAR